jgi:DNA-directed RNA polymerase subunit F
MRKIVVSFSFVLLVIGAQSQPPAGDAKTGEWYGEKITADGAIAMADIATKLEKTEAMDTKIKAKIVEVCPKKGCWLKLQVNDSTTAMVKMKDYGFFLPLAAKGKTVVIDGEVQMKTISVAELQHYAEDAKKSKEEIAAITKPEKEIRVTAKGIVIVD